MADDPKKPEEKPADNQPNKPAQNQPPKKRQRDFDKGKGEHDEETKALQADLKAKREADRAARQKEEDALKETLKKIDEQEELDRQLEGAPKPKGNPLDKVGDWYHTDSWWAADGKEKAKEAQVVPSLNWGKVGVTVGIPGLEALAAGGKLLLGDNWVTRNVRPSGVVKGGAQLGWAGFKRAVGIGAFERRMAAVDGLLAKVERNPDTYKLNKTELKLLEQLSNDPKGADKYVKAVKGEAEKAARLTKLGKVAAIAKAEKAKASGTAPAPDAAPTPTGAPDLVELKSAAPTPVEQVAFSKPALVDAAVKGLNVNYDSEGAPKISGAKSDIAALKKALMEAGVPERAIGISPNERVLVISSEYFDALESSIKEPGERAAEMEAAAKAVKPIEFAGEAQVKVTIDGVDRKFAVVTDKGSSSWHEVLPGEKLGPQITEPRVLELVESRVGGAFFEGTIGLNYKAISDVIDPSKVTKIGVTDSGELILRFSYEDSKKALEAIRKAGLTDAKVRLGPGNSKANRNMASRELIIPQEHALAVYEALKPAEGSTKPALTELPEIKQFVPGEAIHPIGGAHGKDGNLHTADGEVIVMRDKDGLTLDEKRAQIESAAKQERAAQQKATALDPVTEATSKLNVLQDELVRNGIKPIEFASEAQAASKLLEAYGFKGGNSAEIAEALKTGELRFNTATPEAIAKLNEVLGASKKLGLVLEQVPGSKPGEIVLRIPKVAGVSAESGVMGTISDLMERANTDKEFQLSPQAAQEIVRIGIQHMYESRVAVLQELQAGKLAVPEFISKSGSADVVKSGEAITKAQADLTKAVEAAKGNPETIKAANEAYAKAVEPHITTLKGALEAQKITELSNVNKTAETLRSAKGGAAMNTAMILQGTVAIREALTNTSMTPSQRTTALVLGAGQTGIATTGLAIDAVTMSRAAKALSDGSRVPSALTTTGRVFGGGAGAVGILTGGYQTYEAIKNFREKGVDKENPVNTYWSLAEGPAAMTIGGIATYGAIWSSAGWCPPAALIATIGVSVISSGVKVYDNYKQSDLIRTDWQKRLEDIDKYELATGVTPGYMDIPGIQVFADEYEQTSRFNNMMMAAGRKSGRSFSFDEMTAEGVQKFAQHFVDNRVQADANREKVLDDLGANTKWNIFYNRTNPIYGDVRPDRWITKPNGEIDIDASYRAGKMSAAAKRDLEALQNANGEIYNAKHAESVLREFKGEGLPEGVRGYGVRKEEYERIMLPLLKEGYSKQYMAMLDLKTLHIAAADRAGSMRAIATGSPIRPWSSYGEGISHNAYSNQVKDSEKPQLQFRFSEANNSDLRAFLDDPEQVKKFKEVLQARINRYGGGGSAEEVWNNKIMPGIKVFLRSAEESKPFLDAQKPYLEAQQKAKEAFNKADAAFRSNQTPANFEAARQAQISLMQAEKALYDVSGDVIQFREALPYIQEITENFSKGSKLREVIVKQLATENLDKEMREVEPLLARDKTVMAKLEETCEALHATEMTGQTESPEAVQAAKQKALLKFKEYQTELKTSALYDQNYIVQRLKNLDPTQMPAPMKAELERMLKLETEKLDQLTAKVNNEQTTQLAEFEKRLDAAVSTKGTTKSVAEYALSIRPAESLAQTYFRRNREFVERAGYGSRPDLMLTRLSTSPSDYFQKKAMFRPQILMEELQKPKQADVEALARIEPKNAQLRQEMERMDEALRTLTGSTIGEPPAILKNEQGQPISFASRKERILFSIKQQRQAVEELKAERAKELDAVKRLINPGPDGKVEDPTKADYEARLAIKEASIAALELEAAKIDNTVLVWRLNESQKALAQYRRDTGLLQNASLASLDSGMPIRRDISADLKAIDERIKAKEAELEKFKAPRDPNRLILGGEEEVENYNEHVWEAASKVVTAQEIAELKKATLAMEASKDFDPKSPVQLAYRKAFDHVHAKIKEAMEKMGMKPIPVTDDNPDGLLFDRIVSAYGKGGGLIETRREIEELKKQRAELESSVTDKPKFYAGEIKRIEEQKLEIEKKIAAQKELVAKLELANTPAELAKPENVVAYTMRRDNDPDKEARKAAILALTPDQIKTAQDAYREIIEWQRFNPAPAVGAPGREAWDNAYAPVSEKYRKAITPAWTAVRDSLVKSGKKTHEGNNETALFSSTMLDIMEGGAQARATWQIAPASVALQSLEMQKIQIEQSIAQARYNMGGTTELLPELEKKSEAMVAAQTAVATQSAEVERLTKLGEQGNGNAKELAEAKAKLEKLRTDYTRATTSFVMASRQLGQSSFNTNVLQAWKARDADIARDWKALQDLQQEQSKQLGFKTDFAKSPEIEEAAKASQRAYDKLVANPNSVEAQVENAKAYTHKQFLENEYMQNKFIELAQNNNKILANLNAFEKQLQELEKQNKGNGLTTETSEATTKARAALEEFMKSNPPLDVPPARGSDFKEYVAFETLRMKEMKLRADVLKATQQDILQARGDFTFPPLSNEAWAVLSKSPMTVTVKAPLKGWDMPLQFNKQTELGTPITEGAQKGQFSITAMQLNDAWQAAWSRREDLDKRMVEGVSSGFSDDMKQKPRFVPPTATEADQLKKAALALKSAQDAFSATQNETTQKTYMEAAAQYIVVLESVTAAREQRRFIAEGAKQAAAITKQIGDWKTELGDLKGKDKQQVAKLLAEKMQAQSKALQDPDAPQPEFLLSGIATYAEGYGIHPDVDKAYQDFLTSIGGPKVLVDALRMADPLNEDAGLITDSLKKAAGIPLISETDSKEKATPATDTPAPARTQLMVPNLVGGYDLVEQDGEGNTVNVLQSYDQSGAPISLVTPLTATEGTTVGALPTEAAGTPLAGAMLESLKLFQKPDKAPSTTVVAKADEKPKDVEVLKKALETAKPDKKPDEVKVASTNLGDLKHSLPLDPSQISKDKLI